jgi:hypothetical protein
MHKQRNRLYTTGSFLVAQCNSVKESFGQFGTVPNRPAMSAMIV